MAGYVAPLLALADHVITVEPALDRALPAEELACFCKGQGATPFPPDGDCRTRKRKSSAAPDDLILVTGSLFIVGEARGVMTGNSCMPIAARKK